MLFSPVLICASIPRTKPLVKIHKLHKCACPRLRELRESGAAKTWNRECKNTDAQ
jgi:hypothetical protein